MIDSVRTFARRRPWVVATAGAVVGFAATRMLKAARKRRSRRLLKEYGPDPGSLTSYGSP